MYASKVTLRKKPIANEKFSLYLDYYPPIQNPRTKEFSRREFLGIHIFANPKNKQEKMYNEKMLDVANAICSQRQVDIFNNKFGFIDTQIDKVDFIGFFRNECENRDNRWNITFKHFCRFTDNYCKFGDVSYELCNGFRQYLLSTNDLSHPNKKLHINSASSYWNTFRAVLKVALKKKFLKEDFLLQLEPIKTIDTNREFLTIEELKLLANTPCDNMELKRAALFSALTGLRRSDILSLQWENVEMYQDGGYCIRTTTKKTKANIVNPISFEAYRLCGEPKEEGTIFKSLTTYVINKDLPKWVRRAGIKKHITFHCFRHTFATLLIAKGNDIYTVSKMLSHRNVATTQIYAHMIDSKKRTAAESISLQ